MYPDYLQITFSAEPISEISKFINAFKSASSRLIKKEISLNSANFWCQGFCLYTKQNMTNEIIEDFINKKRKKPNL